MRVALVAMLVAAPLLANVAQAQSKKQEKQNDRRERQELREARRDAREDRREERRDERGEHRGGNGGTPAAAPVAVSGVVRNDVNYNGLNEPTDAGLGGWSMSLTDGAAVSLTATTNADGTYSFPNVPAGSYTVCPTAQGGMTPMQPGSGPSCAYGKGWTVTVTTTSVGGVDFLFSLIQAG